ncbi:protein-arginine deiminase type-3-like [Glandiceps talaboti]
MGAGVSIGGNSSKTNKGTTIFRSASQLSLSRSSSSRRLKFLNFEKTKSNQPDENYEEDNRTVRRIKPVLGRPITEVAVRGTSLQIDVAGLATGFGKSLTVESSHPFHVEIRYEDNKKRRPMNVIFGKTIKFNLTDNPVVFIDAMRETPRHIKITLTFNSKNSTSSIHMAVIRLGIMSLSLDVDADRDGVIERNSFHKNSWERGRENYGAVVITRYDTDASNSRCHIPTRQKGNDVKKNRPKQDCSWMTQLLIRSRGPRPPRGWTLHLLFPNKSTRSFLYVYRRDQTREQSEQILGPGIDDLESLDLGFTDNTDMALWVTGQPHTQSYSENTLLSKEAFTVDMVLRYHGTEAYRDSVKCRLSPLIIPPSIQPVVNVYVSSTTNTHLTQTIKAIAEENKTFSVVHFCPHEDLTEHKRSMLFGYTETPDHTLPVVLISPQLTESMRYTLNSEGEIQICQSQDRHTLFQLILATPPIEPKCPLGCLLVSDNGLEESNGMQWTQLFLESQSVQPTVRISTDWMECPDMTSVVNFIPADRKYHQKGFKVVIPDTKKTFNILKHLQQEGLGNARIFEGKYRNNECATTTVNQLLGNVDVWNDSFHFQQSIDQNKQAIVDRLGLSESDFTCIPMLWRRSDRNPEKARPYMPNVTNMIVLDGHIVIPRLHGPIIQGVDKFEEYVLEQIKSLTRCELYFVDNWTDDVHRIDGSLAIQRQIPLPTKWWDIGDSV